jgi:putative membrane protein
MLTDHQQTSNDLQSLVSSGKALGNLSSDLDSTHQKMLDKFKELHGADFTKRYAKDQVSAHKEAVSLFERYAKRGDDAALKDWAGRTLPHLEKHLQMAENLER